MRHAFPLRLALALGLLLPSPALAQEAAAAIAPGSYALLLDGDGLPVAGAYALADGVRLTMRLGGAGDAIVFVDREFMPGRVAELRLFTDDFYRYEPALGPDALVPEAVLSVRRETLDQSFETATGEVPDAPQPTGYDELEIAVGAVSDIAVTGGVLETIDYTIAGGEAHPSLGAGAERVFIVGYGFDLPAEAARRITGIETGTALGSHDFINIFFARSGEGSDETAACILELRKTELYQSLAERLHDESDTAFIEQFSEGGLAYFMGDAYQELRSVVLGVRPSACYSLPAAPGK